MSNSAPWDPSQVLKIGPIADFFSCVGYAPSKGRECHNPIAKANRATARTILADMGKKDVFTTDFSGHLDKLATCLLCRGPRHYLSQHDSMVVKWNQGIERFKAASAARRGRRTTPAARAASSTRAATPTPTSTTSTRNSRTPRTPKLLEMLEALRCELATLNERNADAIRFEPPRSETSGHLLPTARSGVRPTMRTSQERPASSEEEEDEEEGEDDDEDDEIEVKEEGEEDDDDDDDDDDNDYDDDGDNDDNGDGNELVRVHEVQEVREDQEVHEIQEMEAKEEDKEQQDLTNGEEQEHDSHGRTRKEAVGDCCICYEDLKNGEDLAWCKGQCRQNFHATCVRVWLSTEEDHEGTETCPYCRADWVV